MPSDSGSEHGSNGAKLSAEEIEMEAKVGDRIAVESERVGQPAREGKVLEVLSPGPAVHYRVRWADDHETVFFPHAGNTSVIAKRSRARST
jgi:hypothetical protein